MAERWRDGRVFLLGDAAHLITPMWALGLNTGVLDASNLPWRIAWVLRGWAHPALLDGYESEQSRSRCWDRDRWPGPRGRTWTAGPARSTRWATATGATRSPARCSASASTSTAAATGRWCAPATSRSRSAPGDRAPDLPLFGHDGLRHLHDLAADSFLALYFTDVRRRPRIPADDPAGLRRIVVSRWDAPLDSGLRERAMFDPAERVQRRFGVRPDTLVLVRPDAHIAAIFPFDPASNHDRARELYANITKQEAPWPAAR